MADYDPMQHVPDVLDAITAGGLVQLHEALNEENAQTLEELPVGRQAKIFWDLVEKGAITSSGFTSGGA